MPQFEIRAASLADEDDLYRVAEHLNTVNLPHDRGAIRELLELSVGSFDGSIAELERRTYVFVLKDLRADEVIGTSMIIAQLGQRDAPYIYVDVLEDEKYSSSLDKHFAHTLLRIGYSYNGPTEIGGLILRPDYRRFPERLGQFLSYTRFLYMASHKQLFQDEVLAELLPPLEPDGTSHLWEALGRKFTGMTYAEADRLSKKNKEFIKQLFPSSVIFATLLDKRAQAVIGKVGAQTRGVEKMLRRIGFRYAHRVDPFDGGPHFSAPLGEISLVQNTRRETVTGAAPREVLSRRGLIALPSEGPPYMRIVLGKFSYASTGGVIIEDEAADHLAIGEGQEVITLGLD